MNYSPLSSPKPSTAESPLPIVRNIPPRISAGTCLYEFHSVEQQFRADVCSGVYAFLAAFRSVHPRLFYGYFAAVSTLFIVRLLFHAVLLSSWVQLHARGLPCTSSALATLPPFLECPVSEGQLLRGSVHIHA